MRHLPELNTRPSSAWFSDYFTAIYRISLKFGSENKLASNFFMVSPYCWRAIGMAMAPMNEESHSLSPCTTLSNTTALPCLMTMRALMCAFAVPMAGSIELVSSSPVITIGALGSNYKAAKGKESVDDRTSRHEFFLHRYDDAPRRYR
jgi:hypothetical protein